MATHSGIPAWRIPWTEEPGRLLSMGLQSWTWLKRLSTAQEKTKATTKKKMTVIYIGQSVAKSWMELVGSGGKKFSSRFKFYPILIQAMSASYVPLCSNLSWKQTTGCKWLLVGCVMITMVSLIISGSAGCSHSRENEFLTSLQVEAVADINNRPVYQWQTKMELQSYLQMSEKNLRRQETGSRAKIIKLKGSVRIFNTHGFAENVRQSIWVSFGSLEGFSFSVYWVVKEEKKKNPPSWIFMKRVGLKMNHYRFNHHIAEFSDAKGTRETHAAIQFLRSWKRCMLIPK